jgi:hypothetical protein
MRQPFDPAWRRMRAAEQHRNSQVGKKIHHVPIPQIINVSAAKPYMYHPASSLRLVGLASWPTYEGMPPPPPPPRRRRRRLVPPFSPSPLSRLLRLLLRLICEELMSPSADERSSSASKDEVVKERKERREKMEKPDKRRLPSWSWGRRGSGCSAMTTGQPTKQAVQVD